MTPIKINDLSDLSKLAEIAIAASIWRPASVTQEPETHLTQWRVLKVKGDIDGADTIHFVGYAGYEGRVCSPVQTYDPSTMRGVTRSGRVYELVGHPGFNGDAMYTWGMWLDRMGNPEVEDMTDHYEAGVETK